MISVAYESMFFLINNHFENMKVTVLLQSKDINFFWTLDFAFMNSRSRIWILAKLPNQNSFDEK